MSDQDLEDIRQAEENLKEFEESDEELISMDEMREEVSKKTCTKCGVEKEATSEFFHRKYSQFTSQCKLCINKYAKKYRKKNKEQVFIARKRYYQKNKDKIAIKNKQYNKKNKDKIAIQKKQYQNENKKQIAIQKKRWQEENKKQIAIQKKQYNKNNTTKIRERSKKYRTGQIKYNSRAFKQIMWLNETQQSKNRYGKIRCAYCGEWTIPTVAQVKSYIEAINNIENHSMNRIYCSNSCKEACPTYHKQLYPKGHKPATSREVNPLIRQMCFEYDNYECQKCGATQDDEQLHCHHIKGAAKEPLLANDIDNVITLCKTCHDWVHAQDGCTFYDHRRKACVSA